MFVMPLPGHDVREYLREALVIHSIHRNVLSFVSMPANVETPYGNGRIFCGATKAFAREELDERIQEVCTSRRRRSFNAWTTRASLSSKI